MYLLVIALPLLGSLATGFFGRFIGFRGATLLTIVVYFYLFVISMFSIL